MSHNPYTPPSTVVADPALPAVRERPQNVTWAVQLMWLGFALGIAGGAYGLFFEAAPGIVSRLTIIIITAVTWAIGFGIVWWIFGALGKGRNWARILTAIVFCLNVLAAAWVAKTMPANVRTWFSGTSALGPIIYLLQLVIYAVAVVLTLTPSASPWFRQRR
jgi:hypothetical protein